MCLTPEEQVKGGGHKSMVSPSQLRATVKSSIQWQFTSAADHNAVNRLGCSACTAVPVAVELVMLKPGAQDFQIVGSTLLLSVLFDGKCPTMCFSPLHLIHLLAGCGSQNLPEKLPQNATNNEVYSWAAASHPFPWSCEQSGQWRFDELMVSARSPPGGAIVLVVVPSCHGCRSGGTSSTGPSESWPSVTLMAKWGVRLSLGTFLLLSLTVLHMFYSTWRRLYVTEVPEMF